MREIKLRVHCKDSGKVLAYEHFNTILNWGYYWTDASLPEDERICNAGPDYFKHPHPLGNLERVLFTGLYDKDGVDIYESDILYVAGIGLLEVVWDSCMWGLKSYDSYYIYEYRDVIEDIETVRGNIYEHPHLIDQAAEEVE